VDANSAAFSYSYAIVLMDPGHTAAEQPYFKINMYDSLGNTIQCGDYSVVAGGGSSADPDFLPFTYGGEDGVYMPWRTTFAPLQGYIGQNVTIEFVVGDCSQGAHFGYAYIDASCSSMEVLGPDTITCTGPIQITAPPGAASYLWSPTGETTQSITVTTPGQYEVEVTPVTGAACSITLTKDIYEFIDTVNAAFSATPQSICSGESIVFNDQSIVSGIGAITAWEWDFDGDGNVDASSQNPTFQFNTAGTFNVNLNVITQGCSDDTTIQVLVNQTPTAIFSSPEVCLGLTSVFTDNSSGTPSTWAWDFDNDGNNDETVQNPTYTYTSTGIYPVKLTVTDGGICSHDTTINVVVSQNSTAIFTASNACLGVATNFTDASLGGVDTWGWDFNNDGTVDNTTQNPSFTFGTTGTFPVNLQVSVGSNCQHDTTINVTVTESATANFNASTVCFGSATTFTDLSSTGVDSWEWDFNNDGIVDNTSQNPNYNFPSSGTYLVTLQVAIGGNCAHDTSINISVNNLALANFSIPQTCQNDTVFFTDLSSSGVDSWKWDFDNDGVVDNTIKTQQIRFLEQVLI
jgi:PKD repeat protein